MVKKEPAEAAADILMSWMHGRPGAYSDREVLRNAYPSLAHLPADELACHVLQQIRLQNARKPLANAAGT